MRAIGKMQMLLVMALIIALPMVSALDGKVDMDIKAKGIGKTEFKENLPETYQEAEEKIVSRNRYLLWTKDGNHIMWGTYGNGFLVGKDDQGKNVWGIYGKSIFAGMYEGRFFWGRYRNGNWKAHGLFDLRTAIGKYVLFPGTNLAVTAD